MNLIDFKNYIDEFPDGTIFDYSISEPFSWRGSYDEVAFSVSKTPSTKEDVLNNIEKAYSETFHGYKGGLFEYGDFTPVNFESEYRSYSNGEYVKSIIEEMSDAPLVLDAEERLVRLAFSLGNRESSRINMEALEELYRAGFTDGRNTMENEEYSHEVEVKGQDNVIRDIISKYNISIFKPRI